MNLGIQQAIPSDGPQHLSASFAESLALGKNFEVCKLNVEAVFMALLQIFGELASWFQFLYFRRKTTKNSKKNR